MLTVALFTIAKSWNQTTYPSTDEYIMDTGAHINGAVFSSKEKKLKGNSGLERKPHSLLVGYKLIQPLGL